VFHAHAEADGSHAGGIGHGFVELAEDQGDFVQFASRPREDSKFLLGSEAQEARQKGLV
jgi:hypothetical protein